MITIAINESYLKTKVKTLKCSRGVRQYDAITDFVELFPYVVSH